MPDIELSEFAKILRLKVERLHDSVLFPNKHKIVYLPFNVIEEYSPDYNLALINKKFVKDYRHLWNKSIKGGKFLFQKVLKNDTMIKVSPEKFDRNYVLLLKNGVTKNTAVEFLDTLSLDAYIEISEEKVRFDIRESTIFIGKRECNIPKDTNMYDLCEMMFAKPAKTPIEWVEIAERITGMDFNQLKKTHQRTIKDTVYALNEKINEKVNSKDKLFSWKNKFVLRNF